MGFVGTGLAVGGICLLLTCERKVSIDELVVVEEELVGTLVRSFEMSSTRSSNNCILLLLVDTVLVEEGVVVD